LSARIEQKSRRLIEKSPIILLRRWRRMACPRGPRTAPAAPAIHLGLPEHAGRPARVVVRAKGDGVADDSDALQQAIDSAANKGAGGVVFLPPGRYRISKSMLIPIAVRVYGVGKTRPVLVLAPNTPGFQKGVANMVIFTGTDTYNIGAVAMPVPGAVPFSASRGRPCATPTRRPSTRRCRTSTSRSATAIPAASGVRMHTAQHSNLSHIDFRMGSGLAGVYQVGNIAYNLRFYGGRYGILAEKTSPAWQFTLAGLALRRPARRRHPRARSRADAGQHRDPQHAGRHRDRPRLRRLAVGQGRALRERVEGGRRHQQREQRLHPGRLRARQRAQHAGLRALPRQRQERSKARAATTR
jgi:hypothetical protein